MSNNDTSKYITGMTTGSLRFAGYQIGDNYVMVVEYYSFKRMSWRAIDIMSCESEEDLRSEISFRVMDEPSEMHLALARMAEKR